MLHNAPLPATLDVNTLPLVGFDSGRITDIETFIMYSLFQISNLSPDLNSNGFTSLLSDVEGYPNQQIHISYSKIENVDNLSVQYRDLTNGRVYKWLQLSSDFKSYREFEKEACLRNIFVGPERCASLLDDDLNVRDESIPIFVHEINEIKRILGISPD